MRFESAYSRLNPEEWSKVHRLSMESLPSHERAEIAALKIKTALKVARDQRESRNRD